MNFLEQLTAEWYAYRGWFVRTNIKFGRRKLGGWEGEMDVIAYNPKTETLRHIETSTDAHSWDIRKKCFLRKFTTAKPHYGDVFPVHRKHTEQVAVVGFHKPKAKTVFSDSITIILVPDFIREITVVLSNLDPMNNAVPETYPLLRAVQYASFYSKSRPISMQGKTRKKSV
ncbi:MAG: hypothetical protein Q7S29_04715 [Candidatus Peribacter sp.]|nr:hypothetical protein [Candidatus Peribacter sp.]